MVQVSVHSFIIRSFTHSVFAEYLVPSNDGDVKSDVVPALEELAVSWGVCTGLCAVTTWQDAHPAEGYMAVMGDQQGWHRVGHIGSGSLQKSPLI